MSYCVHCGVELAQSEPDCPLCGTKVHNPAQAWQRPEQMPYPEVVDIHNARIDRRYARQLVAILLLIPAFTVLTIDFLDGQAISWSPYVIGALALIYGWLAVPLLFRFSRPYIYVAIDVLSLSGYLLLIALLTDGLGWFLGLVLPLLLLTGVAVMGGILAARRLQLAALYRAALVCLLVGLYMMGTEVILSLYGGQAVQLRWSFYASIPLMAIALVLVTVERNKPLKDEIVKRLFL